MTTEETGGITDDCDLSLRNVIHCPICKNGFTDARTLPCLHSFCRKCLDSYNNCRLPSRNSNSHKFKCPVDHCELAVELDPEQGANGLPRNYFINRVCHGDVFCSQCDRGERTYLSDRYCKDCAENICSKCETFHPRSRPPHTQHTIITIETISILCPTHQLDVKIHCVLCNISMCDLCRKRSPHIRHECHNVSTFRPLLVKVITQLKEDRCKCQQYRTVLTDLERELDTSTCKAKTVMNKCITPKLFSNSFGDNGADNQHYQRAIGDLECQLDNLKDVRQRSINSTDEEVMLFEKRTAGLHSYATYLAQNGTDLEIAKDYQFIKRRAETIWSPLDVILQINALGRERINFVPARRSQHHLAHFEVTEIDSGPNVEIPRLNILLLGETGAGKSTLVNAISLYSKFNSLNDAENDSESENFNLPISVTVEVYDPLLGREKTCVVGSDTNEQHNTDGKSVTQRPKTHEIFRRACIVNLIDTPGVYHTDGSNKISSDRTDADDLIAGNVLELISTYREIHAICVVFKATDNRANEKLCNMFKKIMSYLHQSALKNVIFCQNFSSVNHFSSADSVLKKFFKAVEINYEDLSDEILFCTENSSVSYVAECSILGKDAMDDNDRAQIAKYWKKSADAVSRLVEYVGHLPPYNVIDSISVHSAKMLISRVSGPLTLIARCIINGKCVKKEKTKYGNQICQHASCATVFKGEPVYERVCHERCSSLGHNWFCVAFDVTGQCKRCGHHVSDHEWTNTRDIIQDDPSIPKVQGELDAIIGTAARLSAFHKKYCLIKRRIGEDIVMQEIQKVIGICSQKQHQDENSKQTLAACETLISQYIQKCHTLSQQDVSCTATDVMPMIKALYELPHYGERIKNVLNTNAKVDADPVETEQQLQQQLSTAENNDSDDDDRLFMSDGIEMKVFSEIINRDSVAAE